MTDAPQWVSVILSVVVSLFLPWAVAFVAKSSKRWLNFIIAYASSFVVGGLSAWVVGSFSQDAWVSIAAAITASQGAYNTYWKEYFTRAAK